MPKRSYILALALAGWSVAATAVAEVVVTTDRVSYEVGDSVQISIHNSGPEDLMFVSAPFAYVYNVENLECMYGCAGLPVVTPFPSQATVNETWDTGLGPVVAGTYVVSNNADSSATTQIILIDGVGNEQRSWGTLKAIFRH